jgi:hypothetical protein
MHKLQILEVTGRGIAKDRFIQALTDLEPLEALEALGCLEVGYVGTPADFLPEQQFDWLLRHDGPLSDEELGRLRACWKGVPLPAGTRYAVLCDQPTAELQRLRGLLETRCGDVLQAVQVAWTTSVEWLRHPADSAA